MDNIAQTRSTHNLSSQVHPASVTHDAPASLSPTPPPQTAPRTSAPLQAPDITQGQVKDTSTNAPNRSDLDGKRDTLLSAYLLLVPKEDSEKMLVLPDWLAKFIGSLSSDDPIFKHTSWNNLPVAANTNEESLPHEDNAKQIIWDLRHMLWENIDRHFALATRSAVLVSKGFDIDMDRKSLFRVFAFFAFAENEALGRDLAMTLEPKYDSYWLVIARHQEQEV
ncbi:hypothetical protein DACRYDRAFT_112098 [Dacryopinax primogenitus]|uniref:Uncharacterized protein n=1 Tax=Dacryopinax primogenitus (strain DJM 731) TaxID=1858805 RepID=M5FPK7_DACPD|nr:uncharacterized protein DACRYDRAFT_112098 [Dacryopinax primogenitus]EJT97138.1 hypothetical protein DACRYDRAFT_112098 [Dacryopinax primogenitus]